MSKHTLRCLNCKGEFTFDDSNITSFTSNHIPKYPQDLPSECVICGGELQ